MRNVFKRGFFAFVFANAGFFLGLAYIRFLPTGEKDAIFIDFWGRFTVYSLWFVTYLLYRKYLEGLPVARRLVQMVVIVNVPFFLGLAYFDKISMASENSIFIDFWGRITVYTFWLIVYEVYRHLVPEGAKTFEAAVSPFAPLTASVEGSV